MRRQAGRAGRDRGVSDEDRSAGAVEPHGHALPRRPLGRRRRRGLLVVLLGAEAGLRRGDSSSAVISGETAFSASLTLPCRIVPPPRRGERHVALGG